MAPSKLTGFPSLVGAGGVAANDSTARNTPGTLAMDPETGSIYRYVQIASTSTPTTVEGAVCWLDAIPASGSYVVTPDVSDALNTGSTPKVVGVAQSVITAGNYGWILVSGIGEVRTDGGVSAADYLVGHTVDQEADTMADGEEEQVFGQALEADSTSTPEKCQALVWCL